ncbi:MAG: sodium:proton antiporter [Actinobacteria bacterium HGW-Actinobacteria-4]|nr:MAG: sodium:proton antiporter [Actinobacteria bacterium HGW-Actinobacteria-4]
MSLMTWLPRIVAFIAWYARELLVSNLAVIRDNVTPGQNSTPGIVNLTTHCRTEFEVTLLSALISLTPGTLTLGAFTTAGDGPGPGPERSIYVHGMYLPGPDELREQLWAMERRMLNAVRREGWRP